MDCTKMNQGNGGRQLLTFSDQKNQISAKLRFGFKLSAEIMKAFIVCYPSVVVG